MKKIQIKKMVDILNNAWLKMSIIATGGLILILLLYFQVWRPIATKTSGLGLSLDRDIYGPAVIKMQESLVARRAAREEAFPASIADRFRKLGNPLAPPAILSPGTPLPLDPPVPLIGPPINPAAPSQ